MTDKQRDSINARARKEYGTVREYADRREAFRAGATFALSLIQDDRLFEASKAAMQALMLEEYRGKMDVVGFENIVAKWAVSQAKALLAVLEEEGK